MSMSNLQSGHLFRHELNLMSGIQINFDTKCVDVEIGDIKGNVELTSFFVTKRELYRYAVIYGLIT